MRVVTYALPQFWSLPHVSSTAVSTWASPSVLLCHFTRMGSMWRFLRIHLALKGRLRPRRAPGARCPHTRAKHTLQSPTYLQGWTIAAYLPPFHKHNGHAGFRGQFGQCSLEAPPVLCGTEAEKGAGQASRPRREVRGGGGACAAPTARPQATRSPPARRRDSATCLSPGSEWPRPARATSLGSWTR